MTPAPPALLERVDRQLGRLLCYGAVMLIGGLWLSDLWSGRTFEWWWHCYLLSQLTVVLLAALFGGEQQMRTLRSLWRLAVTFGVFAQLLVFLAYINGQPDDFLLWQWTLNASYAGLLVLLLRPSTAFGATLLTGALPAFAGLASLGTPHTILRFGPILATTIVLVVIVNDTRLRWARHLETEASAFTAVRNRSRSVMRRAERARIARIIHDDVLGTLTAAMRFSGPPPPELRRQAAETLSLLQRSNRAALRLPELTGVELLRRLEAAARRIGSGWRIETSVENGIGSTCDSSTESTGDVTGARELTVPGRVAETLLAAAAEAMRNSVRHAGEGATRTLRARSTNTAIDIEVVDDGAGFDPAAVPADRLGVRRTIMLELDEVEGGSVELRTAPGEGTRVHLLWRDPHGAARGAGLIRGSGAGTGSTSDTNSNTDTGETTAGAAGDFEIGVPSIRAVLVALWVFQLLYAHLTGVFYSSYAPWILASYFCGLIAVLIITRRGRGRLPAPYAIAATLFTGLATLSLFEHRQPSNQLWFFIFISFVLTLLVARGNTRFGGYAFAQHFAIAFVWSVTVRASAAERADLFVMPVVAVAAGYLWHFAMQSMSAREQRFQRLEAAARLERQRAIIAEAESRLSLGAVTAQAGPLLAELERGDVIDDELRLRLSVTEAGLRDRLRSPLLQHPLLSQAVAGLRSRGVEVVLFGESSNDDDEVSDEDHPASIGDPLAGAVGHRLSLLVPGTERVMIRVPPVVGDIALTLVVSDSQGPHRTAFTADGEILSQA